MEQNTLDTKSLILRFLETLGTGDADQIAALFADDVDWNVAGNGDLPWVGRRSQKAHVADYFRTMWSQFAGAGTAVVHSVLVDGDSGVVFATIANASAATGRSFETPVAMHFETSAGEIAKLHLYEDSWAVSNAFV